MTYSSSMSLGGVRSKVILENAGSAPARLLELILKMKFCMDCFTSSYPILSALINGASRVSNPFSATAPMISFWKMVTRFAI